MNVHLQIPHAMRKLIATTQWAAIDAHANQDIKETEKIVTVSWNIGVTRVAFETKEQIISYRY